MRRTFSFSRYSRTIPLALLFAGTSVCWPQTASEDAGTPRDATSAPSPIVRQSYILADSGPRVGVLAYCTDLSGSSGAGNTVNTLVADGRFGAVTLIDADSVPPTASELAQQFDCVVAMTDNRCGSAPSPSQPLAEYAMSGRGVVVTSFGFSTSFGFDDPIFQSGLSPLQRVQSDNAPAGGINVPGAATTPVACANMMAGVTTPLVSTFANYVTLSPGAALCASYANVAFMDPVLAINAAGNVVGFNSFPAWGFDNTSQASYRKLVGNVVAEVCKVVNPAIDIKLCSNPNRFNCKKEKGVLPVTIFGAADLDVAQINIPSLKLCVADSGGVPTSTCTSAPTEWSMADRGNPDIDVGARGCGLTKDGYADLEVGFEAQEVAGTIGCAELSRKETSPTLVLVGTVGEDDTRLRSLPVNDVGIDQLLIQNN